MNESLRKIFNNKYGYAILFSVFLYTLATARVETEPLKWLILNFTLVVSAGLMQNVVGQVKLIFVSWILYCIFTNPFLLLPQYNWLVKTILSIQNMNPFVLLSLLTMNFYSLFMMLEWYEINRDLIWEE